MARISPAGATSWRCRARPSNLRTGRRWAACVVAIGLAGCGDRAPDLLDDAAGIIEQSDRRHIEQHHAYLLADHDIDYRVVTVSGIGDIDRHASTAFESLSVGSASGRGHGLLLVIDAGADRVRLEVSYGLEGAFPDAFVAYVQQRQMVPFFRAGRVSDGILATTELIVARAQRAVAGAGFEGEAWVGSGGAGAATRARLGAGYERPAPRAIVDAGSAATPERTLAAYLAAMANHDARPHLDIYTPATRALLEQWVMTPAQMSNLVRSHERCTAMRSTVSADARHAVIRFSPGERQCPPYFFERSAHGWQLDLATMQRVIRFGRSNAWRMRVDAEHPYEFAFSDWTFDQNGFPVAR